MTIPKFSVVIPCYNTARTLAETIASVQGQTVEDFEIIAVDNNSTDGTRALLEQLALTEPRLRIVSEPVQGLPAARNGGIRAARGSYIALLDADDLFDADYLYAHGRNLDQAGTDISYSRLRFIDMASQPTGQETNPPLSGVTARSLLRSNPCTAMIVVRREVFDKAGLFDETMRRVEDQEWLFRAAAHGARLRGIDRALASYRITPGGLSHDLDAMFDSHAMMLDRAARVAPDLVAAERHLAEAAMHRYCARRAIEQGKSQAIARAYLARMFRTAPALLLHEPHSTLTAIAAVLCPRLLDLGRSTFARFKLIRATLAGLSLAMTGRARSQPGGV